MSGKCRLLRREFQHVILEGSAFDVGKQQSEILKRTKPQTAKWFSSAKVDSAKIGSASFEELKAYYEAYCPGIVEEILGFADGLGARPENVRLFDPPIYNLGNCSLIAFLSGATGDKHVYVARSYEYNPNENDLRLCTARIKGRPKHLGFSELALGRDDGINEHGLCVAFSGGGTQKREPKKRGFNFFFLTRTLLDNCRTVSEALKHLKKTPVSGYWNFLLADKNNNAAVIQFFDGEYSVKLIDRNSDEPYLFVTNHYFLPDMIKYQEYAGDWILKNSKRRFELISKTLSRLSPEIGKEDIRTMLSKEIYDGLCGHYYTDYFGTLFSVIYDVTDTKADICFGAPTHNSWQKRGYSLDDVAGLDKHSAVFPDRSIKTDSLWPTL